MAWLLRASSLAEVQQGTVIGSVLYTLADPIDSVVAAVKTAPSPVVVEAASATTADDATALLNAGTRALLVGAADFARLVSQGVPADRLLVAGAFEPTAAGAVAQSDEQVGALTGESTKALGSTKRHVPVFRIADSEATLVSKFTAELASDRHDGLFTTIVTTPRHRVLGVCFSSAQSIAEAVKTRTGVYQSRKRGLWYKGASSGAVQKLYSISADCDTDALEFVVEQTPPGFCHNNTLTCFGLGEATGFDKLEQTVASRLSNAPQGSYTSRLLTEPGLLDAKIKEEADELCEAESKEHVAWEAADLLYFVSVKLAKHGLSFADVEADLDRKSLKVTRRKGDAKPKYVQQQGQQGQQGQQDQTTKPAQPAQPAAETEGDINMQVVEAADKAAVAQALRRPAQSSNAFDLSRPIIEKVRTDGDAALLELTAKFDKAQLSSPVLNAPFAPELMDISPELKQSIDLACANIAKFHSAQLSEPLVVETSPGVVCSRFSRAIARVGLYVPGGTAILPSTAIHLGVPAQVAGCKHISVATPPRQNGTPSPEVVYVAHKIGAAQIVLAGGAQAVAAMAYGTDSVTKVDKICGPGNQFVTAAKMICSTDVNAQVSIDMPAGPSEVLVVADTKANKRYVASDLLSQAEHGADSQVVLIAIKWTQADVGALQAELHKQALELPRCDVVRKSIAHSSIIVVGSRAEALALSNQYAPEHLILQTENAAELVKDVANAGSVFVGGLSPESCGDYTSGTNHTLPTYGFANQYSGVNTGSYLKYITSQELTEQGLANIGEATVTLAECEGLRAHANAVRVRLGQL